jgi:endoglucanase
MEEVVRHKVLKSLCTTGAFALTLTLGAGSALANTTVASDHTLPPDTHFYVDPDSEAAHQAVIDLLKGKLADPLSMAKLASWPEAAWFTKGTPAEVSTQVKKLVSAAGLEQAVPVPVAYNIPLRDCGQYSSGGAASDEAYRQWISAFA